MDYIYCLRYSNCVIYFSLLAFLIVIKKYFHVYREIKDMILVIMHNSENRMSHVSHLASYRTV